MSRKTNASSKGAGRASRKPRLAAKKTRRALAAGTSINIDQLLREIRAADPPTTDAPPKFTIRVKSEYDRLKELGGPADLGFPDLRANLSMFCNDYPLSRVSPTLARVQQNDAEVRRHWPWVACAIALYASERREWTKYASDLAPKEVWRLINDIGRAAHELHTRLRQLHDLSHRLREPTAPSHRGHLSWLDALISQAAAGRVSSEVDDSGEALLTAYEGKGALLRLLSDIEQEAKIAAKLVDKKLLNRERPQSDPALPNFVFRCGLVWWSLTGRKPSANKVFRHRGADDPEFVLFIQELAKLGKIPPPSRTQVETSLKKMAPSIKAQFSL